MAMTGDLRNNLRRLQSKLKLCNYPKDMDIKGISKGLAQEFLPIIHYILLDFSRPLAEFMVSNDIELYGKNDTKFMMSVYKVFRDIFHYKPSISRQQFFSIGYAEHKIILVVDLIRMVKDKHKELVKALPKTERVSILGQQRQRCGSSSGSSNKAEQPGLLAPATTEPPANSPPPVPINPDGRKVAETDIGYHTAETSPTFKSQEEKGANSKRPMVSVNELRAKFEASGLRHDEISDSKLSDADLEENPVIQALVKQIVHLEEQMTAGAESTKAWQRQTAQRLSNMQAHMVLMQNTITLLESKLSGSSDPAHLKTMKVGLAQGIIEDIPTAFLKPNQRRAEDVPLPASPLVLPGPSHAFSPDQTPPPLSISAVSPDHRYSQASGDGMPAWYPAAAAGDPMMQDSLEGHRSGVEGPAVKRAISAVAPLSSVQVGTADSVDVVTVVGAGSPVPMDVAWVRPCSSTPRDDAERDADDLRQPPTSPAAGEVNDNDDIDEGLVDVEDGELGEYIQEAARDFSQEMLIEADSLTATGEEEEEEALEEDEMDEVPVRDVGRMEPHADEPAEQGTDVSSQILRVQDMLTSTQQMLAMNIVPEATNADHQIPFSD